jgi:hypothetical protein
MISGLMNTLPGVERTELVGLLGREWSEILFRTDLDPKKVLKAEFATLEPILETAVREQRDILDLLTRRELAVRSRPALLLDAELLDRIDAKYNLHSIWQIKAQPSGETGKLIAMRYMLIGQGRLIIGYPKGAVVEVGDPGETGEYRYEPVTLATIRHEPTTRGLYSLKTLRQGQGGFGDFIGPMGSAIRAYEVRGERIRVTYQLFVEQEMDVARKPIVNRQSPHLNRGTHARSQSGTGGS